VTVGGLSADALAARWRAREVPLVGRVADGRALVDLRTILPEEDGLLGRALIESAAAA
jgi:hypothetical protein